MIESKKAIPIRRWMGGLFLLCAASALPLSWSLAQDSADTSSRSFAVYEGNYEYDGRTFQNIDELTRALEEESVQIQVMECGTGARIVELLDLLREREEANVSITGINPQDCESVRYHVLLLLLFASIRPAIRPRAFLSRSRAELWASTDTPTSTRCVAGINSASIRSRIFKPKLPSPLRN